MLFCAKKRRFKSTVLKRLQEIINRVNVKGFDRDSFKTDLRTVYAVTRCLEIISEASRRLPDALKDRHSTIAWRQMASAGNVYRHDYEDVAAQLVWDTVQRAIPPLRVVIEQELTARTESRSVPVAKRREGENADADQGHATRVARRSADSRTRRTTGTPRSRSVRASAHREAD